MSADTRIWLVIGCIVVALGILLSVTAQPTPETGTCPAGVSQHENTGC